MAKAKIVRDQYSGHQEGDPTHGEIRCRLQAADVALDACLERGVALT